MEPEQLTFSALEARIEAIPEHPSHQLYSSRRSRWGSGIGIAAALLGLTCGKILPPTFPSLILTCALFVVEFVGLLVALMAELPTLNLRPSKERRQYAETLDFDMPRYLELVSWLRGFPRDRLVLMVEFSTHRLERLRSKLPLLTGSIEKLGALPLVTGLYLQLKDLHWPLQIHWPQILLIAFLMLFYWVGILQLSLRFRLEEYDALLRRSLDNPTDINARAPSSLRAKQMESAL